jgi:hypothetical protein
MQKLIFTLCVIVFINSAFSQSKDEMEIRNALHQQTIAWNANDMEKFMQPYWHSDSLMFIGKLSVLYYSVVGKWHLARTIGDLNGYFTLLFKKINNRWMIISDHSS